MATYVPPKRATAFIIYVGLEDQANAGLFKANPTLAAGDFKISKDGGALANLTDLPTVAPASGKLVKITLTATEMAADNATVVCSDAAGAEWYDLIINIATAANQVDDIKTDTAAILEDTGTTLPSAIADVPTLAEFEARTLPSADYTVVSDLPTTGAIADAVWDEALSGHSTPGTSGAILEDTGTTLPAQITDIQGRIPAALVDGRIDANAGAISGDATAADNLEAVLDGTGGVEVKLKKLTINNPDDAPGGQGIDIVARTGIRINATDQGINVIGSANQALYLATSTGAATIYIEGPSIGGGSAIALSSPGSSPAGTREDGSAIFIETSDAHPAIRVDFGGAGGDVMDIKDSDAGDWVWDDTIGQLDDGAITAAKFDQSTAFPLTQADAGATAVARTGADSDTLETLSDQIDGVGAGSSLTAQETRDAMKLAPTAGSPAAGSVDAHLDTLIASTAAIQAVTDLIDTSAVTVTASNNAGLLTVYRGVTFAATVSGLTISASWTKVYLTVKTDLDLADTAATIQVIETNPGAGTDGLLYLNGAAPVNPITYADASLTVDQGAGTVAIALSDNLTAQLARGARLHWDLKQIISSTSSGLLASGTMDIELTPTRTI